MIPLFTLRLICGLSAMWTSAPRQDITWGFFRIQMLLTLGLSVLLGVTLPQLQEAFPQLSDGFLLGLACLAGALGLCSFMGSVLWTLQRRAAGGAAAWMISSLSILGLMVLEAYATSSQSPVAAGYDTVNGVSSAYLTGGVIATMLLGHWYLTATGMKLTPFISYTWMLLGVVILRIAVVLAGHWVHPLSINGVWEVSMLVLRWAGLLGPLLLTVLTLRILRYRNTQSATGVLYAAAALVFLGEMAAVLLAGAQAISPAV